MTLDPKPVTVSKGAFAFCRYTVMVLVWAGFFLKIKLLVVLALAILVLSALLTVGHSPLIVLYNLTLGRFVKSSDVELDLNGMRFAHILGSVLALICVAFLYSPLERAGWRLTFVLALLKTISAIGLCPAYKLFGCMTSGTCCPFLRKS